MLFVLLRFAAIDRQRAGWGEKIVQKVLMCPSNVPKILPKFVDQTLEKRIMGNKDQLKTTPNVHRKKQI